MNMIKGHLWRFIIRCHSLFYILSHCAVSQDKKCFEIAVSPMILHNLKGRASLCRSDNKHGNTFK